MSQDTLVQKYTCGQVSAISAGQTHLPKAICWLSGMLAREAWVAKLLYMKSPVLHADDQQPDEEVHKDRIQKHQKAAQGVLPQEAHRGCSEGVQPPASRQ